MKIMLVYGLRKCQKLFIDGKGKEVNMKKIKVFTYHYPGMVYATHWYEACSIPEAKKQIREYLGLKKLPNGFAIWEQK
jgi:hypothetical protein